MKKYLVLFVSIVSQSCEIVEYHPYDGRISGETGVNARNITRIAATLFAQDDKGQTEERQTLWNRLVPTHIQLQYAGGMGFLSGGAGWDYGRKNRWETDVFLSFLPRYSTKESKWTFTLKQNYIPWNINTGKRFSMAPFSCGLYANTVFNEDFWVSAPDKYPNRYYAFSTKVRFYVYIGQRITCHIPHGQYTHRKSITFFYEINSNDLYIISAAENSRLKPADYLKLSFGLKVQLSGT
jgi:hypothetical protein